MHGSWNREKRRLQRILRAADRSIVVRVLICFVIETEISPDELSAVAPGDDLADVASCRDYPGS
jgi:hypothetical protein